VGEDQMQHVEITREIARTFNNRYGNVLKIPEVTVEKQTARIVGVDGQRKMSKSLGNDLPIFAEESEIRSKIMSITTDPSRIRPTDPGDPEKNVCFSYLRLLDFDKKSLLEHEDRYRNGTIGDVEIKKILFETFMQYFKPFRDKKVELSSDISSINTLRKTGSAKANIVAHAQMVRIKRACGLS
jgi:tryptophanyl-tRNA synthetase